MGPRRLHLGSVSIKWLFWCAQGDPCRPKAPRRRGTRGWSSKGNWDLSFGSGAAYVTC